MPAYDMGSSYFLNRIAFTNSCADLEAKHALVRTPKSLLRKNKTHFMRGTYVIILKLKYILYQIRKSTKKNLWGISAFLKNQIRRIFKKRF